jgi:hypothetical protein
LERVEVVVAAARNVMLATVAEVVVLKMVTLALAGMEVPAATAALAPMVLDVVATTAKVGAKTRTGLAATTAAAMVAVAQVAEHPSRTSLMTPIAL